MEEETKPKTVQKKPKPAKKAPTKKKEAQKTTKTVKKSTKSVKKSAKTVNKKTKTTKKPAKKPAKKTATKKKKKKTGRPSFKITKAKIKKAGKLAAGGLTKKEIATCLGIHYDTLNEKAKEFSEFSEAIEKGRADSIANVVSAVYKKALTGDIPAAKYFLNNRNPERWKDKREHHVLTEEVNREITQEEFDDMSDEELEAIANAENVTLIGAK